MKKPLLLTLLMLPTGAAMADIASGIQAYYAGNYEAARKEFTAAATAGSAEGKHLLASLYYQGHGVPRDLPRAVALFREAAIKL